LSDNRNKNSEIDIKDKILKLPDDTTGIGGRRHWEFKIKDNILELPDDTTGTGSRRMNDLIQDILSQQNTTLSVNIANTVFETKVEEPISYRIRKNFLIIGDRTKHMEVSLKDLVKARFAEEPQSDGTQRFNIILTDSKGQLRLGAYSSNMDATKGILSKYIGRASVR
jgi:hypothetical protein